MGECVPTGVHAVTVPQKMATPKMATPQKIATVKINKSRCPKGTRKNKMGECVATKV
jgi:hypothetical protein